MKKNIKEVGDAEFSRLIRRLEFYDTTRNTLLAFSFTAVLTVLGVAVQVEMDTTTALICLIPYFLIVPFTARISYYRISSAHISAFLRIYVPNKMIFEEVTQVVKENHGKGFRFTAWLVNHEMVLLAMASSGVFYLKFIPLIERWGIYEHICVIAPVLLLWLVYAIAHSSYDYKDMTDTYKLKWKECLDKGSK